MYHYTGEKLNFIFRANAQNLEPKIDELNKCEELVWVNINEIPKETTDKVKTMQNIINEEFYYKM